MPLPLNGSRHTFRAVILPYHPGSTAGLYFNSVVRLLASLALLLTVGVVAAQPGPGAPLTLGDARAHADRIAHDDAIVASKQADALTQVHAARDRALAIDELRHALSEPALGGARSIEDGAERELQARAGLSFADVRGSGGRAWRRCLDLVRSEHVRGDDATDCIRSAAADTWGSGLALVALAIPPPAVSYASAEEQLRVHPGDAGALRDLAALQLATADYEGTMARLQPLRGTYDVDLTVAVALLGLGRLDEAEAVLVALVLREPARPEAHFNLAELADTRRYESPKRAWITTQDWRAFIHFRAFLCARGAMTLRSTLDSWRLAADGAEMAEHRLTGGSHWWWATDAARPRPFLAQDLLPPHMRDDEGARTGPSSTCAEVMSSAAINGTSASSDGADRARLPLPKGCACRAAAGERTDAAVPLAAVAIALALARRRLSRPASSAAVGHE